MNKFFLSLLLLLSSLSSLAQTDNRTVVGVADFSCQQESPFTGLVTEKVVEMLTNTKRFRVVDRTSYDKVHQELELQKSEAFLDSKNLAQQDVAVGAEKLVTGRIIKIPVYAMTNSNGTVRGYKASVAFEMKVVDVATGLSSEATSFQGKTSKECLSPEAAVTMAMVSIQDEIMKWFKENFQISCNIVKILDNDILVVNGGEAHGIEPGMILKVEMVEEINGMPYHQPLGEIRVKKTAGQFFSECTTSSKSLKAIKETFESSKPIICTQKKK